MHEEILLAPVDHDVRDDLSSVREAQGVTALAGLEGLDVVGKNTVKEAGRIGALEAPHASVREIGETGASPNREMLGRGIAVMKRDLPRGSGIGGFSISMRMRLAGTSLAGANGPPGSRQWTYPL
jgi:hypothetical protein